MPCDCRMRVICSSVSGRDGSSSSISFLTRRFRISRRSVAALGTVHALAEEVAQFEHSLRSVGILAGHGAAHGGRMHADFFRHLLDHHRLQLVDASFQEILLPGHDRVANLHDGLLALLDVLDQLDRALVALFDVIARVLVVAVLASAAACRRGSGEAGERLRHS